MKATLVAGLFATVLLSSPAFAFCQLEATEGAPNIPATNSSRAEVRALGEEVQRYIDEATARLAKCKDSSEGFLHNIAVLELEQTAQRYNALTRRHNQSIAHLN